MVVQFVKKSPKSKYYYESPKIKFKTLVDFDFKKLFTPLELEEGGWFNLRNPLKERGLRHVNMLV